jgi:hypothetical protein
MIAIGVSLSACSPEVGSREWCDALRKKPQMNWTAEELKNFTKYCIGRER